MVVVVGSFQNITALPNNGFILRRPQFGDVNFIMYMEVVVVVMIVILVHPSWDDDYMFE